GCRGNGSLLPLVSCPYALERNIVVAGPGLLRERLGPPPPRRRGRRGPPPPGEGLGSRRHGRRGGPAAASHELDALGNDLDDGSLATILGFPLAGLQPALDQDGAALVEVLPPASRR